MAGPLRLFTIALFKRWWELMGCAAFGILCIYVAHSNRSSAWAVTASGLLAAAFLLIAAYRTWKDEHEKYSAEVAKNERPEIKGEAFNFAALTPSERHESGKWACIATLRFEMSVCNQRSGITNLTGLKIDGISTHPPIRFSNINLVFSAKNIDEPPPLEPDREMQKGIAVHLFGSAIVTIERFRLQSLGEIDLSPIKIWLMDGFSGFHLIDVRAGETLVFSTEVARRNPSGGKK